MPDLYGQLIELLHKSPDDAAVKDCIAHLSEEPQISQPWKDIVFPDLGIEIKILARATLPLTLPHFQADSEVQVVPKSLQVDLVDMVSLWHKKAANVPLPLGPNKRFVWMIFFRDNFAEELFNGARMGDLRPEVEEKFLCKPTSTHNVGSSIEARYQVQPFILSCLFYNQRLCNLAVIKRT